MNLWIILGIIVVVLLNIGVLLLVLKKKGESKEEGTGLRLILDQINNLSKVVDDKIGESNKTVSESMKNQFTESQNLVQKFLKEVTMMAEKVTRVEETGKQMVSFAEQLKSLQDILKNPKQRGVLGEYYLETLLKNVLPPGSFQMQYSFTDGEIVDAIVKIKDKIIPVDSKFSLENYNRLAEEKNEAEKNRLEKVFVNDLKNRIVETAKYIRPNENTMEFAFMFIPHEAIYYDLLVNKVGAITEETDNLIQRAANKYKVIIVSPTSFLAYLQTVLQGLKAMQIEETTKDIVKRVGELSKHLKSYEDYHNKLGNSLSTVVNHYTFTSKEFKKIDKDVLRITGENINLDLIDVSKPDLEE